MDTLRTRLTFANITACLALLVALSGGAYAASLPRHSVGSKQLKNNAVTSAKVKNGSLSLADLGSLPTTPPAPTLDAGFSGSAPVPPGTSTQTAIRTINGVKFSLDCQGSGSGAVNVQIESGSPAAPAVRVDGMQTRSDSYPVGSNNVTSLASTHLASASLVTGFRYTAFTGMVQADTFPPMFLSVHSWIESGSCFVQGVTSEVTH